MKIPITLEINKLLDDKKAFYIILESIKLIIPCKFFSCRNIIISIISIIPALLIQKSRDIREILSFTSEKFMGVSLVLLAIAFTGYGFFQVLITDEMMVPLCNTRSNGKIKLMELNEHFICFMILHVLLIILDVVLLVYLKFDIICFMSTTLKNYIIAIFSYLFIYSSLNATYEFRCLILDLYKIFNIYSFSRIIEINEKHLDYKQRKTSSKILDNHELEHKTSEDDGYVEYNIKIKQKNS